jgi:glycosyltransferase involved in cell wall biosynthesis
MRGGEKCLEDIARVLPQSDLHALFHVRGSVSPALEERRPRTSFLQHVPGIGRRYRSLLPLFPAAVARFDLRAYDLIVSSSHCVAKGAGHGSGVPHVSYCYTPMRYLYDQAPLYFHRGRYSAPVLVLIRILLRRLRAWDLGHHPDRYIAISRFVAERIRRLYGRESEVIHPPVDLDRFRPQGTRGKDYLIVSAMAPYKRIDLAIRALERLGRSLVVVGSGEDERRLQALAGPRTRFRGWLSDEEVARLHAEARAFLLPGEEDFGITPLEAMASGTPVIALARGGALETVVDARGSRGRPPTGVLFEEGTEEGLARAVLEFEAREAEFHPESLRAHAEEFSRDRFRRRILRALADFAEDCIPGPRGLV